MSDKIAAKLLPCPFCGGQAALIEGEECAYIQCLDVKMHRAMFADGDNAVGDEVVEQWNRRTPSADHAAALTQRVDDLTAALRPFAIATEISKDSLPSPADIGHRLAVAQLYVGWEHFKAALAALPEGAE